MRSRGSRTVAARSSPDAARGARAGPPRAAQGPAATLARRQARLAYALLAPTLLIVGLLVVFPILWNLALSFQRLRLVELRRFDFLSIDLTARNYVQVIGDDFLPLLARTLGYAILGTSLALLLGLWAALVVRSAFPGRFLVRGLLLFPYVVPVVAAALLWRTMLNPQFGIVNAWLARLGLPAMNFLLQERIEVSVLGATVSVPLAFTVVVLFEAWRSFPFAFLFILARLQAIPAAIEEAALVDGATISQRFFHVLLPQLRGVFAVLFLLRFIWTFNAFDEIYVLTAGAAGTSVISVQIYEWLFGRSNIGAAAALSIVLALTLACSLAAYFRWFAGEEAV